MFHRRPNISRLARRQRVDRLISALGYHDHVPTREGDRIDLGTPVRVQATRALAEIGGHEATKAILDVAMADASPSVRGEAIRVLAGRTESEVIAALVSAVCDWRAPEFADARREAALTLWELPAASGSSIASAVLDRPGPAGARPSGLDETETWAVRELLANDRQKATAAIDELLPALARGNGRSRRAEDAIVALAPWGASQLIAALTEDRLAAGAAAALGRRRDGASVESLIELLESEQPAARSAAAAALGELRDPKAADPLLRAVGDEHHEVRLAAAAAVDKLGPTAVMASGAGDANGEQASWSRLRVLPRSSDRVGDGR
jgi:HEAT repeat protein